MIREDKRTLRFTFYFSFTLIGYTFTMNGKQMTFTFYFSFTLIVEEGEVIFDHEEFTFYFSFTLMMIQEYGLIHYLNLHSTLVLL